MFEEEGWTQCVNQKGEIGSVPSTYIEILPSNTETPATTTTQKHRTHTTMIPKLDESAIQQQQKKRSRSMKPLPPIPPNKTTKPTIVESKKSTSSNQISTPRRAPPRLPTISKLLGLTTKSSSKKDIKNDTKIPTPPPVPPVIVVGSSSKRQPTIIKPHPLSPKNNQEQQRTDPTKKSPRGVVQNTSPDYSPLNKMTPELLAELLQGLKRMREGASLKAIFRSSEYVYMKKCVTNGIVQQKHLKKKIRKNQRNQKKNSVLMS